MCVLTRTCCQVEGREADKRHGKDWPLLEAGYVRAVYCLPVPYGHVHYSFISFFSFSFFYIYYLLFPYLSSSFLYFPILLFYFFLFSSLLFSSFFTCISFYGSPFIKLLHFLNTTQLFSYLFFPHCILLSSSQHYNFIVYHITTSIIQTFQT